MFYLDISKVDLVMHMLLGVFFKCFIYFISMLQVSYLDVSQVDLRGSTCCCYCYYYRTTVGHYVAMGKAERKTRHSLARSRSLMARLELDSFYNEPARFIMSQLEPAREP
jgi:hypothetical protein